jgi:hypothetical protein
MPTPRPHPLPFSFDTIAPVYHDGPTDKARGVASAIHRRTVPGNHTPQAGPSYSSPENPAPGRLYLGCDPGKQGGLVLIRGVEVVTAVALEKLGLRDVFAWIETAAQLGRYGGGITAVLEKVGGYLSDRPGNAEGGAGNTGHTMFQFGKAVGHLEMALVGAGIEYTEVVPRVWQATFAMKRFKGEKKEVWKNRLKAAASFLFPGTKFTKATADAALIAAHARLAAEAV